jgi:hypothetical protein
VVLQSPPCRDNKTAEAKFLQALSGKRHGKAISNAIADYRTKSGKTIWGMAIMVDKARPL